MGFLSFREGKDGICDYAPADCLCRQSATHGFLAKDVRVGRDSPQRT
jgi:hypothetical protein